jgi:chromosome segregation ATPase
MRHPTRIDPLSRAFARWIGTILIGTGLLGGLISLTGLFLVAVISTSAETALLRELDTLDEALIATNNSLWLAKESITEARATLTALSATVGNVNQAITDTQPAISTLQDIADTRIPHTIDSTQQALASAQEAAMVADGVLEAIAVLGVRYDPDVPLHVAIERISASLSELPASLDEVSVGLRSTSRNIDTVATDLTTVAVEIDAINENVGEAERVVVQFQAIVRDLRDTVSETREEIPTWILSIRLATILLLIWLGLSQIGLLVQGWQLLGRGTENEAKPG